MGSSVQPNLKGAQRTKGGGERRGCSGGRCPQQQVPVCAEELSNLRDYDARGRTRQFHSGCNSSRSICTPSSWSSDRSAHAGWVFGSVELAARTLPPNVLRARVTRQPSACA